MNGALGKILFGVLFIIAIIAGLVAGSLLTKAVSGETPIEMVMRWRGEDAGPSDGTLDLSGEWRQSNSDSADSYQGIYITENTIEIYLISEADGTTALYWSGSFTPPSSKKNNYQWESENNKAKTELALFASHDDTKEFAYKKGKISYSASALGVDATIEAERGSWGYSEKISQHNSSPDSGAAPDGISFEKHTVTSGTGGNALFDIAVGTTTKAAMESLSSDEFTKIINNIDFSGTNGNAVLMFEDGTGLSFMEASKDFSADYGYIDVSEGEFTMTKRLGAIWNDTDGSWHYMTVEEMLTSDAAQ